MEMETLFSRQVLSKQNAAICQSSDEMRAADAERTIKYRWPFEI